MNLRIREVSDRLIRNIEDLDAVRGRAAVTQEELLSRLSEQMNSRMYVLSVVAAIFLPLGFLTGLLGIYAVCTVSCWHRCRADAVVQAKKMVLSSVIHI
jgi:hypothetical protein